MILRKLFAALVILAAWTSFGANAQGQAQPWPSRTVRIVVPYAAGGNSDVMARVVAQRLTEHFGQTFIVENRVGANGALAADTVARSPADGYTLLWAVTPPMTIAPAMAKLNYDPIKDFAPISAVAINGFVLVVHKDFPPKTLTEFIAYVKAQKEKMSYAEGTAGSVTHLAMALFAKRAGLEMTNVSYRGNAPAMNDVIAGHLKTMFSNVSDALPHAASGAIRLLAVSTAKREAQAPERSDRRGIRFPRFQRGDLERLGGAGHHAARNRRQDRRRDRPRGQGPSVCRAAQGGRRRSARQHAGRVRRLDQGRHGHLGGRGRGDGSK